VVEETNLFFPADPSAMVGLVFAFRYDVVGNVDWTQRSYRVKKIRTCLTSTLPHYSWVGVPLSP
jgi:hypothetical protein